MFSQFYVDLSRKKIKYLVSLLGNKYFMSKSLLDIGSGHGEMAGSFFRLGAVVTASDAREMHLKSINKKYNTIKTCRVDLDAPLNINNKFDVISHFGTLCHLKNWESNLKYLCGITQDLLLETAVCDSDDVNLCIDVKEDKSILDASYNGIGSRPSSSKIESVLNSSGMYFIRIDSSLLNHDKFIYDWKVSNSNKADLSLRRFWFCSKNKHLISQLTNKIGISANNLNSLFIDKPVNPTITTLPVEPIKNFKAGISPAMVENSIKSSTTSLDYKKFVIVIPSYKNEQWAEKNILSALNQNYDNFRIIYVDDCSPDNTFEIIKKVAGEHKNRVKCTLMRNAERKGALENLYNMIHSCEDDEIIVTLDGDDWLSDDTVLSYLNKIYCENNIWLTYGRYKSSINNQLGAREIPKEIINLSNFREYPFCASHLRTFYSSLFKKINKEDLMYEGKFMSMAWDVAMMIPMLEMCGDKFKFIDKVLYIYNMSNPISDFRVDEPFQQKLDRFIRTRPKYNKCNLLINNSNDTHQYNYDGKIFISVS